MNTNREAWLIRAVEALKPLLSEAGFPLLTPVRVSCGFPSGGQRSNQVGECWSQKSSDDAHNQIFISPVQVDAVEVLDTLLHELIHAVDDCEHKHGKAFKKIATKLGMVGPMRSASAGPKLKAKLQDLAHALGAGRTASEPGLPGCAGIHAATPDCRHLGAVRFGIF